MSATTGIPTAQDRHPNCSSQLASETSSSSNKYQPFPGCFLLLTFTPSFQACVLEEQRRLHSSLRQVSDGDADGDADGWHWGLTALSSLTAPSHTIVLPPTGLYRAQGQRFPSRGVCTTKVHRQPRLLYGLVKGRVSPVSLAALVISLAASSVTRH